MKHHEELSSCFGVAVFCVSMVTIDCIFLLRYFHPSYGVQKMQSRQSHLKVKPLLRNWSIKGKSFTLLKPCQLLIPNSMHLQSRPRVQQKWVDYLNSGGPIFISLPLSYHCVSQNWQLGVKDTKEPCHRIWIRGVWTNCFLISVHEENVGPNSWFLPSANLFYLLKGTCQFLSLSSL